MGVEASIQLVVEVKMMESLALVVEVKTMESLVLVVEIMVEIVGMLEMSVWVMDFGNYMGGMLVD